jgi:predicted flap endonuclease-1-like 5' DNA nuclease
MTADLTAYLPLILAALAALVLAAWVLMRRNRKTRIVADESDTPLARDVLAEGAAPAPRNQALIDAPRGIDSTMAPSSAAADSQPPAAVPPGDDLTRIKGLGPKIAGLLGESGITTYAQIAALTPAEAERIDAKMGRFSGRITRDQWIEQAKLLAAGDEAGFTARFGNNG